MKLNKILIIVLIILNIVVLLGQIMPEEAPPFAREVNIVFLSINFLYFLWMLIKEKKVKFSKVMESKE